MSGARQEGEGRNDQDLSAADVCDRLSVNNGVGPTQSSNSLKMTHTKAHTFQRRF